MTDKNKMYVIKDLLFIIHHEYWKKVPCQKDCIPTLYQAEFLLPILEHVSLSPLSSNFKIQGRIKL